MSLRYHTVKNNYAPENKPPPGADRLQIIIFDNDAATPTNARPERCILSDVLTTTLNSLIFLFEMGEETRGEQRKESKEGAHIVLQEPLDPYK